MKQLRANKAVFAYIEIYISTTIKTDSSICLTDMFYSRQVTERMDWVHATLPYTHRLLCTLKPVTELAQGCERSVDPCWIFL